MRLKLKKFNPAQGGTCETGLCGCFTVLVGRRNSGKSVMTKDLCYHLKDQIDLAVVISPTEEANLGFSAVVPPGFIFREPCEKHLERLMEFQRKQKKAGKGKNLLLIIDDAAWDRTYLSSKAFKQLCFNGRHLNMTVIVTIQYCMCIPPAIRSQVDMVIQLNEKQLTNRKAFHENFAGFTSFEELCSILDKATVGYDALVVWNKSRSNTLDDCLFWYKADLEHANNVRLCNETYWKLSTHYDAENDDDPGATGEAPKATERPPEIGERTTVIDKADDQGKTCIGY